MNVRLMRLAEHEGTAITDALGGDLWKLLKLDIEPPPVLFKPFKGDWGGYCHDEEDTAVGEIELNGLTIQHSAISNSKILNPKS